jgi:hypothetical protein
MMNETCIKTRPGPSMEGISAQILGFVPHSDDPLAELCIVLIVPKRIIEVVVEIINCLG